MFKLEKHYKVENSKLYNSKNKKSLNPPLGIEKAQNIKKSKTYLAETEQKRPTMQSSNNLCKNESSF